jgi:hypothetical protein
MYKYRVVGSSTIRRREAPREDLFFDARRSQPSHKQHPINGYVKDEILTSLPKPRPSERRMGFGHD